MGENIVLRRPQTGPGLKVLIALVGLAVVIMTGLIVYALLTPDYTPRTAVERDLMDAKTAVKDGPNNYDARIALGAAYAQVGGYAEAVDQFKAAAKLKPDNSQPYFNIGFTYREMGRLKEAKAQLKKAVKLNPNWTQPYYILARIYAEQGDYDKALAETDKIIKLLPRASDVQYLRGTFYEANKDKKAAIAAYKEAFKYDPAPDSDQAQALKRLLGRKDSDGK